MRRILHRKLAAGGGRGRGQEGRIRDFSIVDIKAIVMRVSISSVLLSLRFKVACAAGASIVQ